MKTTPKTTPDTTKNRGVVSEVYDANKRIWLLRISIPGYEVQELGPETIADLAKRIVGAAMDAPKSRKFKGYWQRAEN